MSIYFGERGSYLKQSLDSILRQTVLPAEIVLVKDGPLNTELDKIICKYKTVFYKKKIFFHTFQLKKNCGLGIALNYGLKNCKYNLVARMDTDDICLEKRFEKQLDFMLKNINISVVGSDVSEFSENSLNIYYKKMPQKNFYKFSKLRNPLSHPSVMFKKEDIFFVGNYQPCANFEDFYLWIRLIKNGFKIANISTPLVRMRATSEQYSRRRGWSYVKDTVNFSRKAYSIEFFGKKDMLRFICIRVVTSVIPKSILVYLYKHKLRKRSN